MNWRVGLFRIWVLFTAQWIAGWAVYGFSEWRNSTATYEIIDPSGLKFIVRAPRGISKNDVSAFVSNLDDTKKRQADCAKDHGPWCDFPTSLEMPTKQTWLISVVVSAVAGPIIVFIFGVACMWIISGFRRPVRSNRASWM
jgi:hypothetical protein